MGMFTRDEAFGFIEDFLQIENAIQRMNNDKKNLLDEIALKIMCNIPFQSISLLSKHPKERRKPTPEEIKSNFVSGRGGLCFDINTPAFHLLSAIGFNAFMTHSTVTLSTPVYRNNHLALLVKDVEKQGDQFLFDVSSGYPLFQAISLDFEKESHVYVNSFLEMKFVRHEGQILRMHRRGDSYAMKGRKPNSENEFWLDDWRRFYWIELQGTTDEDEFHRDHENVYVDHLASPFHLAHHIVIFRGRKGCIISNGKILEENIKGELEVTPINGGDDGIVSAIQYHFPAFPEKLVRMSLQHWRPFYLRMTMKKHLNNSDTDGKKSDHSFTFT